MSHEASLDKSISENFPHYNKGEQALLRELVFQVDPQKSSFQKAKEKFLDLLYKDLVDFYRWDASNEDRVTIRKRLLNVAGLFFIVPIQELRDLSHRAKLTLKKVVYEVPPSPNKGPLAEMHSYDIKYIEGFSEFFSQIVLDPQTTALDYIAGNREKRQYPHSQFTVFRENIQEEVISQDYLTASAEPLTQTQFISIYNPNGTPRDLITVGFDLVYESAFIDFFHNAPNVTPITLPRNAHIMGKHFLLAAVNECLKLKRSEKEFLKNFPLFLFEKEKIGDSKFDDLLYFITESLVPQIRQKIKRWNLKLGLDPENDTISWGETE